MLTYCIVLDEPAHKRIKPTLQFEQLGVQAALNNVGTYASVKQKSIAGFSTQESLLYVRRETAALWNALNRTDAISHNLSVSGPPGTGKSTEVWAWALWKAQHDRVVVTWFHMTPKVRLKVLIDGIKSKIIYNYLTDATDIIEASEGSILIVDGVTTQDSRYINHACYNWRLVMEGRRYIVVSSASASVAVQVNTEAKIVEFTVGSWTFEQYQSACEVKAFFDKIKGNLFEQDEEDKLTVEDEEKQLLLAKKFYFAGGCARWMFEFTYDLMMNDLQTHLLKVSNYALCFVEGGGDETSVAVNHLRGVTVKDNGKYYFFISQHVTVELAMKCHDKRKFLVANYREAAATQNPAFEGWIFEFDVNYQLEKAHRDKSMFCSVMRSGTADGVSTAQETSVDKYEVFNSSDDLSTFIKTLDIGEVLWAKPKLWCQKAYDFICVWKSNDSSLNMVVANATLASKHSILLTEVTKLATELGMNHECPVESIRFDFIIPKDAQFTFGGISGQLCGWKNLVGDQWPNKHDAADAAFLGFLVVTEVARTLY